jgi:hypothetical protein
MLSPRRFLPILAALAAVCLPTSAAHAHAFGQRYDLPLPLIYYIVGAGAVVALTFVVMALFVRESADRPAARHWAPWRGSFVLDQAGRLASGVLQVTSVLIFAVIVIAGFFGEANPTRNFAPTFVWVIWWVGLVYVQALVGDLWAIVNPWRIVHRWAETLATALRGGREVRPLLSYPKWLGYWPALAFFWIFAWLELVSGAAEDPPSLAWLIVGYSLITWGGMTAFGRRIWLERAETFSVVFGFVARFAPLAVAHPEREETERTPAVALRPPGVGLLVDKPLCLSAVAVVLLMLASVTYDGLAETPLWAGFLDWVVRSQELRAPLLKLQGAGIDLLALLRTLGLVVMPLVFAAAYALFVALTAAAAGEEISPRRVAGSFVLTLVPIAFAYHLAHYFSFLLLAGQLIIPLLSDPFGFGWNLFGTANHTIDIGIVSMKTIWWVAVAAIVVGHLYAVYLAHVMALRLFTGERAAIRSQIPLMVLMVCYTMVSLWILSQPIVETG